MTATQDTLLMIAWLGAVYAYSARGDAAAAGVATGLSASRSASPASRASSTRRATVAASMLRAPWRVG